MRLKSHVKPRTDSDLNDLSLYYSYIPQIGHLIFTGLYVSFTNRLYNLVGIVKLFFTIERKKIQKGKN